MKRSAGIVGFIAEAACLAAVLVAQPASAATGWTAPVRLGGDSFQAGVVLFGGGGAAAVWQADRGAARGIYGAIETGGRWRLAMLAGSSFEPAIAPIGDAGGAFAVWVRKHVIGRQGVEAAIARPGGGWTRLPPIPRTGGAFTPRVAADAAGRVTVVWEQPGPRGSTIDVATRAPGGGWSAVKRLSRSGRPAETPRVAVDPTGAAVAIWRRERGASWIVQAVSREDATAPWSSPVDLAVAGNRLVSPSAAIDPDGEAVAVWQGFDGSHQIVQASVHPAAGRWTQPADLSARGRNAQEAEVAMSPTGEAIAIWERFDGRIERIQSAARPFGDGWSEPEDLSGTLAGAHEPALAIGPDGLARAVWEGTAPLGSPGGQIEDATHPAGGPWTTLDIVEVPELWPVPALAVGADGEAAMLWSGYSVGAVLHPAAPGSP